MPTKATPNDTQKARADFRKAGLTFPRIPDGFADKLKEQDDWVFSTRKTCPSPYSLDYYVNEFDEGSVEDYVALAHSGHGVNSYALQYYLVRGDLGMFLHLGWGGVYSDPKEDAANIRDCFSLADEIVMAAEAMQRLGMVGNLKIVACDFYGSYWASPEKNMPKADERSKRPAEVLTEVLDWLRNKMKSAIEQIGREMVKCSQNCFGIECDQADGILPRCLIWEEPEKNKTGIGCAVIGINPGRAKSKEMQFYKKKTYDEFLKYWEEEIKKEHPYYCRPREMLRGFELNGPILWTDLVKCQNDKKGAKGLLPLETLRTCMSRYLSKELELIPSDWPLIALGGEVYRALAYMYPERTVIGVPHPTGSYGLFPPLLPGGKLYRASKSKFKKALEAPPGQLLRLGNGSKKVN